MVKGNVLTKSLKGNNILFFSFCILTIFLGCQNNDNPKLIGSNKICNDLWRVKYRTFSGGAYSAELYKDYITDSVNFRVYVGEHDESSNFDYICRGDSLIVRKFKSEENGSITVLKTSEFRLSQLKAEHKFEGNMQN